MSMILPNGERRMTAKEAADRLGVPVGVVNKHIQAIRESGTDTFAAQYGRVTFISDAEVSEIVERIKQSQGADPEEVREYLRVVKGGQGVDTGGNTLIPASKADSPAAIPFVFEGRTCRVVMIDGEPWWVLRDVCDVLGIDNPRNVAARLETDEKDVRQMDTLGGPQNVTIVNESGLYTVILRSDKPEAKAFRKWVTSEVLPSIRKTGTYSAVVPRTLPAALRAYAMEIEAHEKTKAQVALLTPKAAVADAIASVNGLKSLSEVGKITGIGPRRIFTVLVDAGILFRKGNLTLPYQEQIEAKRFVVRERPITIGNETIAYSQTFVTGKGECYIAAKFGGQAPA